MQQQSNGQNKFLIDADIGDDDVTLPNLPSINVPIVETTPAVESVSTEVAQEAPPLASANVCTSLSRRLKS